MFGYHMVGCIFSDKPGSVAVIGAAMDTASAVSIQLIYTNAGRNYRFWRGRVALCDGD